MARKPEDKLKELGARIDAVREARRPKRRPTGGKYAAAGFGWRMTIDLVAGVLVGAAMGWGLDSLFGSKPLFLIVMIMFGFAAGVKVMLKSAEEYQKDHGAPPERAAPEERDRHGDGT